MNFPELQYGMVDLYVNKDGQHTRNGFVQVSDRRIVRRVVNATKQESMKCSFAEVNVLVGSTAIDRNRNWALYEAERLIKMSSKLGNGTIVVKKADDRGVHVDGLPAFTQRSRYAKGGVFHGVFSDLTLP